MVASYEQRYQAGQYLTRQKLMKIAKLANLEVFDKIVACCQTALPERFNT